MGSRQKPAQLQSQASGLDIIAERNEEDLHVTPTSPGEEPSPQANTRYKVLDPDESEMICPTAAEKGKGRDVDSNEEALLAFTPFLSHLVSNFLSRFNEWPLSRCRIEYAKTMSIAIVYLAIATSPRNSTVRKYFNTKQEFDYSHEFYHIGKMKVQELYEGFNNMRTKAGAAGSNIDALSVEFDGTDRYPRSDLHSAKVDFAVAKDDIFSQRLQLWMISCVKVDIVGASEMDMIQAQSELNDEELTEEHQEFLRKAALKILERLSDRLRTVAPLVQEDTGKDGLRVSHKSAQPNDSPAVEVDREESCGEDTAGRSTSNGSIQESNNGDMVYIRRVMNRWTGPSGKSFDIEDFVGQEATKQVSDLYVYYNWLRHASGVPHDQLPPGFEDADDDQKQQLSLEEWSADVNGRATGFIDCLKKAVREEEEEDLRFRRAAEYVLAKLDMPFDSKTKLGRDLISSRAKKREKTRKRSSVDDGEFIRLAVDEFYAARIEALREENPTIQLPDLCIDEQDLSSIYQHYNQLRAKAGVPDSELPAGFWDVDDEERDRQSLVEFRDDVELRATRFIQGLMSYVNDPPESVLDRELGEERDGSNETRNKAHSRGGAGDSLSSRIKNMSQSLARLMHTKLLKSNPEEKLREKDDAVQDVSDRPPKETSKFPFA